VCTGSKFYGCTSKDNKEGRRLLGQGKTQMLNCPRLLKKKGGYRNRLRPSISPSVTFSCPVHYYVIYQRNFKLLGTIVCYDKTMCHAQKPGPFLQGQCHTCRLKANVVFSREYVVLCPFLSYQ
jgi:hypothetical protein